MSTYTAKNAENEDYEIQPGHGFCTYFVKVQTEEESAWSLTPIGQMTPCEINHPWDALDRYEAEDLERFGITVTE
jgi:hypothetical protein